MAQTRTPKGTASSKTSGTTLTIPDVSMNGGDELVVAYGWDQDEAANPTVTYGGKEIDFSGGVTTTAGNKRLRVCSEIVNNTRTADLVVTWPANVTARGMIAVSLHQAGKFNIQGENEDAAATISTTGVKKAIDHIQTILMAFHLSEGPTGDSIGSSSTGCTLGQRAGTTGDADTTNVTLQETYKIISALTVAAGSFVVDDTYQIKTVGTTDFTLIGATSNTIGEVFVATGVGSGTGDAYNLSEERSRLSGLTSRDHVGIMFFFRPKYTFSISKMLQYHRNVNENPDWVQVLVVDDGDAGFWVPIDPDDFDDWSDAVVDERLAKYVSIWVVNHVDNNLSYEADTARDTRMATFIGKEIIV